MQQPLKRSAAAYGTAQEKERRRRRMRSQATAREKTDHATPAFVPSSYW
jgi:hypothetical protein